MSQVFRRGTVKAEMNMTPLIDITFQLIIFFILTLNVASQEVIPMIVPKLENPKTQDNQQEDRLVVNIIPLTASNDASREENPLNADGLASEVRIGQDDYPLNNPDAITAAIKDYVDKRKAKNATDEPLVLLRADAAAYYDAVAPVMAAIAAAGVERINLVAFLPEPTEN